MRPEQVDDLLTWIIIGVLAGGRLGYVLFYQPAHYLTNPLEILMIWQGGMSFHGGFLGVVIVALIFCWRTGADLGGVSDVLAFSVPPGLFLGRLSNFVNAELWGASHRTALGCDIPWAGGSGLPKRDRSLRPPSFAVV